MRMLEKVLDEFIQAYLHVLKTDVLMTSRAGELINTSLDDFIKPWCERIRFMKDTAVLAENEACAKLVENMKGCGAVSTPADDWCEQKILNIAQAIRARPATEAPQ